MELKKYTRKEAEKVMEKVTVLIGLSVENLPSDKTFFFEVFIEKVLNVYGDHYIYDSIIDAASGKFKYDLKLYNKPVNIVWFIELVKANPKGKKLVVAL